MGLAGCRVHVSNRLRSARCAQGAEFAHCGRDARKKGNSTDAHLRTAAPSAAVDDGGVRQGGCRLNHAACFSMLLLPGAALMTASRFGLSVTAAIGVQSRARCGQNRSARHLFGTGFAHLTEGGFALRVRIHPVEHQAMEVDAEIGR